MGIFSMGLIQWLRWHQRPRSASLTCGCGPSAGWPPLGQRRCSISRGQVAVSNTVLPKGTEFHVANETEEKNRRAFLEVSPEITSYH